MTTLAQGERLGSTDLAAAARVVAAADRVFIGAAAGLSAAAGYDYTDRADFARSFPALTAMGFGARYEMMGRMLPPRLQWGFWARHVTDIRLGPERSPLYAQLREAVGQRPHFVLTSNVDALFVRNGFDAANVYTPQGDYALAQCYAPCRRAVWDSVPIIERALADLDEVTGQTSAAAVPLCPHCGGAVHLNVNGGRFYVDDHFRPQAQAMMAWFGQTQQAIADGASVVVIDAGSGFNTPGVVRWPTEQITAALPGAHLVRINRDHAGVPARLADRSFSLTGDATAVIAALAA